MASDEELELGMPRHTHHRRPHAPRAAPEPSGVPVNANKENSLRLVLTVGLINLIIWQVANAVLGGLGTGVSVALLAGGIVALQLVWHPLVRAWQWIEAWVRARRLPADSYLELAQEHFLATTDRPLQLATLEETTTPPAAPLVATIKPGKELKVVGTVSGTVTSSVQSPPRAAHASSAAAPPAARVLSLH